MFPSPTRMFLTKGIGVHRHALTAFEFALRDADIEQQNLVYVSSILPPHCEVSAAKQGSKYSSPGISPSASWPDRRPMNSGAASTPASALPGRQIRKCTAISQNCTDTA